jgi:hypothetical protein
VRRAQKEPPLTHQRVHPQIPRFTGEVRGKLSAERYTKTEGDARESEGGFLRSLRHAQLWEGAIVKATPKAKALTA